MACAAAKGYAAPEVEQAYDRARTLCRHLDAPLHVCKVLAGLRGFYQVRALYQTARSLAEQHLDLAQRLHNAPQMLEAHYGQGEAAFYQGEFVEAQRCFRRGLETYQQMPPQEATSLHNYGIGCHFYRATLSWILGYPTQTQQQIQATSAQAQALANPYTQAMVANYAARVYLLCGAFTTAQAQAERLIALATERSLALWVAAGTMYHGSALALQGQHAAGIAQITAGLAAFRATGTRMSLSTFLTYLATAHLLAGELEAAQGAIERAWDSVMTHNERHFAPEIQRLAGELLLRRGATARTQAETEACFLKAIELAQRQQAHSWELRAVTSLSRLWQQQGKRTAAHQALTEAYGWFREGFETADLQAARACLASLSWTPPKSLSQ